MVEPCLYAHGVVAPTPVQPHQFQSIFDKGMTRIPVFNVKEVDALAENTRLLISLDAESLFRVQAPETLLQIFSYVFAHLCLNSDRAGLGISK
jgi:hypothetical protein